MPDFDSVAFKTELMGEINTLIGTNVNTAVNGATKSLKTDFEKMIGGLSTQLESLKSATPPPAPAPDPNDKTPKTIAELNGTVASLKAQMEETTKKLTASEEKAAQEATRALELERVGTFDRVVNGFTFANDVAKGQFRDAYMNKVVRDDSGAYIVKGNNGEPMAMDAFMKTQYDSSPHMQPSTARPGTGAGAGSGQPVTSKYRPDMTTNEIMALSPAERSQMYSEISAALPR